MKDAESALRAAGFAVTSHPTQAAGHATELARELAPSGAVIVAAGGDGTINEVLNGLVGSGATMGILPLGTANVLAMETGMGRNPVRVAERMASYEPVRVPVGRLCDSRGALRRHFLLMAGAGLDAHIVANIDTKLKHKLGKGAYWIAGFSSLTRRLEELLVTADTTRYRCSFALAARVRNYGGDLEIARRASLLGDKLELMLFEGSNPFRYLKYFTGVLLGGAARMSGVTSVHADSILLEPANGNSVHIHLDGEDCGTLPVRIEMASEPVTLLLPPEYVAKERARWKT